MLLMTPLLLSHTPVRIAVHDGLEMVVWPLMLEAPVVPRFISSKNRALPGSSSTLLRLVPSTPITRTCCVVGSVIAAATSAVVTTRLRVVDPAVAVVFAAVVGNSGMTGAGAAGARGARTGVIDVGCEVGVTTDSTAAEVSARVF